MTSASSNYNPTSTPGNDVEIKNVVQLDNNGDFVGPMVTQTKTFDKDGVLLSTVYTDTVTGAVVTLAAATTQLAETDGYDSEVIEMCSNGTTFFRKLSITPGGNVQQVADFDADGNPFVAPGTVTAGSCEDVSSDKQRIYTQPLPICIENPAGTFTNGYTRDYEQLDHVTGIGIVETQFKVGTGGWTNVNPTGTVTDGACPVVTPSRSDEEIEILCNTSNVGVVTRFIRRYSVDDGGVVTFTDTTLDGTTAYTPTGTVGVCGNINVTESNEPGCANGVPYTRRRVVYSDAVSGQQLNIAYGWFNSANVETATAPAGFTLGPCVQAVIPATNGTSTEGTLIQNTAGTGTVPAGKNSVSFTCISGTVTVDNQELHPTENRTWEAYLNPVTNVYARTQAHTWTVAANSDLHIIWKD